MTSIQTNSKRSWSALLALAASGVVWTPSSQSAASYPSKFPWRGDALEPDVHFRAKGHTGDDYGHGTWAIDFHAAKWENPNWQSNDGGGQNTDEYIFGVDVYSPIDGEIVACWRTAPDKPSPDLDYDLDGDGEYGEANNCVVSGDECEDDGDCFALWPTLDTCGPGHDVSPMIAGNHVQIRNEVGDFVLFFAHLQDGSIPPELCPLPNNRDNEDEVSSPGDMLPGADGWPDDRLDDCDTGEGFPRDTLLPTPVPVEAGQFIGRVGHSGASSGPHLHMHAKPLTVDGDNDLCLEISEEIVFYESWAQMCDVGTPLTGGWSPLDGNNPLLPYDFGGPCVDDLDCVGDEVCSAAGQCVEVSPTYCFIPGAFGVQEDSADLEEPATNLHLTTHADGDVLVYQNSGVLSLRSWDISDIDEVASLDLQDTYTDNAVLDVAVARPNGTRDVIVSIRQSNDKLRHIPFTVSSVDGEIVRVVAKEKSEGTVYEVESTPSPAHAGYVAAVEGPFHQLAVFDYHVTGALDITRDLTGNGTGGTIDDVAITTMTNYEGVVTAEIDGSGELVVRSFDVPAVGGVTNNDVWSTSIDGVSVTIDTVPTAIGGEYVVTSVIRGDGTLRLDSWEVDDVGTIDWLDESTAGVVSEHDGTAGSTIAGNFVVGVRDDDDELALMGWDVGFLGQLRQSATIDFEPVTQTAIVASSAGGGNYLVAARTDALGELHLFVYNQNFDDWF